MKTILKLDKNMRLIGTNSRKHETNFDTSSDFGGENTAPSPMEVMLQALAACSSMDILSILRKKRKTIQQFKVTALGDRAEFHPKVFVKIHLIYELTSPDAELLDLEKAIELSEGKYCSISAMIKNSGCELTHNAVLNLSP